MRNDKTNKTKLMVNNNLKIYLTLRGIGKKFDTFIRKYKHAPHFHFMCSAYILHGT